MILQQFFDLRIKKIKPLLFDIYEFVKTNLNYVYILYLFVLVIFWFIIKFEQF